MTDEQLKENGYQYYAPSILDGECVTGLYQRSFGDDETYKKYFLTWKKWDFSRFADQLHLDLNEPKYEGNTQLGLKDGSGTIDITFLNGWELDKAEKFMKQLFATGWFEERE